MKTSIIYLITGLLVINSLSAQVKIGDRPQNLDPASVLELESTSRVLVITRVTDVQMNNISPLQGAVVYNTDQECLHYYNGTEWINICEALDNSFTTSTRADYFSTVNPAQSKDSTVVISQTENADGSINYNYEVGLIRGANIVNTTINGDSKLQNGSVTRTKFQPGENQGDLMIWRGQEWALVNESELNITEKDSIVGNEFNTGSAIDAGIFTITDGGGDLQTNFISDDGDNDITSGGDGALYFNETLTTITDNGDGTLTYTDEDGNPTNIDLTTAVEAVE
ncbi:hypothetical protein VM932_07795, partial [Muricauda sp. SYSU M86414]|nr:hypothetical protein [Muricauda sp. SYSU M86414]